MEKFSEWLDRQLISRNWSRADLSRKANISQATLSLIYSGQRSPGNDVCEAIAHALDLPPVEVFRAAGLLPPSPELTPTIERAIYYLSQLHPEDQERVMLYLEVLASRYKREKIRP